MKKKFTTLLCTIVLTAVCVTSCSTKSQLVGRWSYNVTGLPGAPAGVWEFSSDHTCRWRQGSISGETCTYTVTDDGTVKIEFSKSQKAEGKLDGGRLTIKAFGDQFVLTKQ